MKTIITTISIIALSISAVAQVAIGKETVDGDGILDFENPTTKGIAIPKIINLDGGTVPGTFYFDTADSKVKFTLADAVGTGIETMDLSVKEVPAADQYDAAADGYDALQEEATVNGTVIGAETSTVPGALVLESTEKALILPKVTDPHITIKDPEPGMIVYDLNKKMLCVYNGYQWAFWGE